MEAAISISKEGRRFYLVGNTYPYRGELKAAGAHWDRDRRAWWTSKRDVAESVASKGAEQAAAIEAVAHEERVAVTGNTYPVREQLRAMGGSWDAANKAWMVPASKAAVAQALVPARQARTSGRRGYGVRRPGGRCRGCGGAIVSAPHHRAMGGYCGSCAFDEFDC